MATEQKAKKLARGSSTFMRMEDAAAGGHAIIHRYDANADGVVDNDEYLGGVYGEAEQYEIDGGEEPERPVGWSTKDVFAVLEEDTRSIVPEVVPGTCASIMEYAVDPNDDWKKVWNTVVLAAVLFSAFVVPYSIAFTPDSDESMVGNVIDLVFYVDMGLNFFTGFDKGYEVILDKRAIVHNYLRGWFLIDFVATVNWESMLNFLAADPSEIPTWVKKLAMLKILRLARMGRLVDNLTKSFTVHSGYIEAVKFFVYTLVVCHLLACLFFAVPMLVSDDDRSGFKTCARDDLAHDAARRCILNEKECGEDDFPTSGVGWYWEGSCMQGSWREEQGHEELCLPGICGAVTFDGEEVEIADFDATKHHKWVWALEGDRALSICPDGTSKAGLKPIPLENNSTQSELPASALTTLLLECIDTASNGYHRSDPKYTACPKCSRPWRMYIDSLYWSLTTMTTIGYGDRGPSTESELVYTIFAQVFGLAFFALLLTQINNVNDLLGLSTSDFKTYKNSVLQFMDARHLDRKLVVETIKFLNFRNSALSGNSFDDDDPRFEELSAGVRRDIRRALYVPPLKRIGSFGWDNSAEIEENGVKAFFDRVDSSGDGRLDRDEIRTLFKTLDIELNDEQFNTCFLELDRNGSETVDFVEFSWWWFKTKYGVPRNSSGTKAPDEFLTALADRLTPRPFPIDERLVAPGKYGQNFVIILQGTVRVLRPGVLPGLPGSSPNESGRITRRDRFVEHDDREPMFGFMACLTKLQFEHVRNRTDYWAVDAETYVDSLWCTRKDFYQCFTDHWLKGRSDMVEMAYYHYEVGNIIGAVSEMDGDGDGVVDHNEFLQASAAVPHGFADHHYRDTVGGNADALDVGKLKAQEEDDLNRTEMEMLDDDEILRQKVRSMAELCARLNRDVVALKSGLKAVVKHQQLDWQEEKAAKQTDVPTRKSDVADVDSLDLTSLAKRDLLCLAQLLGAQADEHMKKEKLNMLIKNQLQAQTDST